MRTLLVLVALVAFGPFRLAAAQTASEPLAIVEVIEVPGVGADGLFSRAEVWFAESFVNSTAVLEVKEKETHRFVGNGQIPYRPADVLLQYGAGQVRYTIKVELKDGKARLSLTNFSHDGDKASLGQLSEGDFGSNPVPFGWTKGLWKKSHADVKKTAQAYTSNLAPSLRAALVKAAKDENW